MKVHDAKSLAVRRGLRAAIALPGGLALMDALTGDVILALFAAFAAFALLALADFGGPPRERATAYLVATGIGAGLIAIGTLVSQTPWLAGVVTLIVGFVIMEVAAFGGAWAAGMFGTALAYVLSATLVAPASDIPTRVEGWVIGGVAATVMALVLWPVYERPALWNLAADALRECARLVRSGGEPSARAAANEAVHALRVGYGKAPYRPSGPAVRDRAFVALMEGLERMVGLEPRADPGEGEQAGGELRDATADVLEQSAAFIDVPGAPAPDLEALDAARRHHREVLGEWAGASLRTGMPPDDVLTGVESAWWPRIVSFVTIAVAADLVIGRRGTPLTDDLAATLQTPIGHAGGARTRLARVLRVNLDFGSIRFHNAVRTAVGLALAVLIAGLLTLDHAFWVGLAALSVLRSNALATGRTAIEAVGGTVLGFAVIFVFFGIFDAGPTEEWIVLPIATFLAAYAPTAISFLVGQAAFSVTIILLFDLIEPAGWQTGVVRIEDIALGAGVSLVVGLLLWPRGAIGMLRRVLGTQLRADADYFDAAMEGVVGAPSPACQPMCDHAIDTARRVADTYDDLLAAPGGASPGNEDWAAIAAAGRRVQAGADLLTAQAKIGFVVGTFPDAASALRAETDELVARLHLEADAVEAGAPVDPAPPEETERRRAAEVETLGRWGGTDAEAVAAVVGVVWASEVLHAADLAVTHAATAITAVSTPAD